MSKNKKYLLAYLVIFAALGIAIFIIDHFFFPHNDSYRQDQLNKDLQKAENRRAAEDMFGHD